MKLLSIDGGGIKGIIAAQILHRIECEFNIVITEYFDAFAGTSAGSMIIGALVYGGYTGENLLEKLFSDEQAKKLMKQSLVDVIFDIFQTKPKYSGREKTKLITETVGDKKIFDTNKIVIIPCFNASTGSATFFKSFYHSDPPLDNHLVSEIIDASSAAPFYFPAMKIGENGDYYIDGGVSANNPVDCAYVDLPGFGTEHIKILSIGSGLENVGTKHPNAGCIKLIQKLPGILMDGSEQTVSYRMNKITKALGDDYIRIDGPIENSSIDDTSTKNLNKLREIGDEWFESHKAELKKFFSN